MSRRRSVSQIAASVRTQCASSISASGYRNFKRSTDAELKRFLHAKRNRPVSDTSRVV